MQNKNKKIMWTQPSLYNLTAKIRTIKKGKLDLKIEKLGI
jgi:hypothetical protein